jgi:hypothetical protein
MTVFETIGMTYVIFTSALGTWYLFRGGYRHHARIDELATRGELEIRRDCVTAGEVRSVLFRRPCALPYRATGYS